jgi:hypothetical protein
MGDPPVGHYSGLPERGDDVLREQLDLALLLLPGHEALVEEPAEPLEVAGPASSGYFAASSGVRNASQKPKPPK